MRLGLVSSVYLTLLTLALANVAGAEAGAAPATYLDAVGDAGDAPDIARVTIRPESNRFVVDVKLAKPTELGRYGWILFGVDTDRNPFTGGGRGDEPQPLHRPCLRLDGRRRRLRARRELRLQAVGELGDELRGDVLHQAAAVLGDRPRELEVGDDVDARPAAGRRQGRLDRRGRVAAAARLAGLRRELRAAREVVRFDQLHVRSKRERDRAQLDGHRGLPARVIDRLVEGRPGHARDDPRDVDQKLPRLLGRRGHLERVLELHPCAASSAAAIARFASTCARWTRYSAEAYVSPTAPPSASGIFSAAAAIAASSTGAIPIIISAAAVACSGVPVTPPTTRRAAVHFPPSTFTRVATPTTA